MDRTDICMDCRQGIRWVRRGKPQGTAHSSWALFTGECGCARRSHSAVRAQAPEMSGAPAA